MDTSIDSTTSTTGNLIEAFYFKNPGLPLRPYHGLNLMYRPSKLGEPWCQDLKTFFFVSFYGTQLAVMLCYKTKLPR
jgi:hypothetical protein